MPKQTNAQQTPATLVELSRVLSEFGGQLVRIADGMRERGIQTMEVPNEDQRKRGLVFLESFIFKAQASLRRESERLAVEYQGLSGDLELPPQLADQTDCSRERIRASGPARKPRGRPRE